jgi:hypothetical protein
MKTFDTKQLCLIACVVLVGAAKKGLSLILESKDKFRD